MTGLPIDAAGSDPFQRIPTVHDRTSTRIRYRLLIHKDALQAGIPNEWGFRLFSLARQRITYGQIFRDFFGINKISECIPEVKDV